MRVAASLLLPATIGSGTANAVRGSQAETNEVTSRAAANGGRASQPSPTPTNGKGRDEESASRRDERVRDRHLRHGDRRSSDPVPGRGRKGEGTAECAHGEGRHRPGAPLAGGRADV